MENNVGDYCDWDVDS